MLQGKTTGKFWHRTAILAVLLTTACSHPSAPARERFKPSPTHTRHVTFLQWTDPHVFDAGTGRHAEGVREEELDNWAAFHWAVLETNRMVLAEHRAIDFVVITGDFGLENVQLPDMPGLSADGRDCQNRKPGDEGPIDRVDLAEAATRVARELHALIVKRVYLVPGNNDLCNEDPRDLHRWAEFVFALQQHLASLYQARQDSLPADLKSKASNDKDLDKVEVFDLIDSVAQLYGHDPRVSALFPNGTRPQPSEPQVINGIHLLGLNSAFFKSHGDAKVQAAADAAILAEINRVGGNVHPGEAYLVFTHIPDLRDPFLRINALEYAPSWTLPGKNPLDKDNPRNTWKNILGQPGVLGVFAGHFHSSDRNLYPHNFTYTKQDETAAEKSWLAPPLAKKYQWHLPEGKTARGMLLVSVNADGEMRVSAEDGEGVQPSAIWYARVDQRAAIAGDEKLAQGRADELSGQWEDAANKYREILGDANVDARTRTTALTGYWHAREKTRSWWWQSRVARWMYLDGRPLLYSIGVLLALALAIPFLYAAYGWLRNKIPYRGQALINSTVQLTTDAPDKEFAARLRAEGEEIKNLLTKEKETWAAGHITLLTPAGSSFDQLVGSIPKVGSVAVSDWVKFLVSLLQTFRWTVQTGIAVLPPKQTAVPPPPAAGTDRLVPGSEVSAYAVLQWGWIVRKGWYRKLPVENDRSALRDLARDLAALIIGEGFV
jgi:hypothetical protein